MASAATNNKAVLDQLVANMIMQSAAIKALLQELKPQRGSNNSGRNYITNSTNHTLDGDNMRNLKKRNSTLQHTIMKGWTKGCFCLSHVFDVFAGHNSSILSTDSIQSYPSMNTVKYLTHVVCFYLLVHYYISPKQSQ